MKVSSTSKQLVCILALATAGSEPLIACSFDTGGAGGGGGSTSSTSSSTTTTTTATSASTSTSTAASTSSGSTSTSSGSGSTSSSGASSSGSSASTSASSSGSSSGGSGCTTTIGELGDAGTAKLITGFDNATATTGWSYYPAATTGTYAIVPGDGHTCPPALGGTITSGTFGSTVFLQFSYATAADWSAYKKLHLNVKVVTDATNYASLASLAGFVNSGGFAKSAPGGTTNVRGTLDDGKFHEIVYPLSATTLTLAQINVYAIQLTYAAAPVTDGGAPATDGGSSATDGGSPATDGGAPAPGSVTVEIDDVWLE